MAARGLASGLLAVTLLLPAFAAPCRRAPKQPLVVVVPGGRMRLAQLGARTIVSGIVGGRRFSIALPAEEGIYFRSLYAAQVVGSLPGPVVILSVDYTSRPPGAPTAECGAGVETVLRVIALRPRPHQTFHQLVASCWKDIDDPGEIVWNGATSTMVVEHDGPTEASGHAPVSYGIDSQGNVLPIKVKQSPGNP